MGDLYAIAKLLIIVLIIIVVLYLIVHVLLGILAIAPLGIELIKPTTADLAVLPISANY